jgi:U3 small nucleolar RNA-associated protein 20
MVSLQELNSAIDFTSVYEMLLPIVQTLPQLLLHKEKIIGTLLSNMKLCAIHSLAPILR